MLSKNEILDLFPNNSFVKEVYLDWVDFMDLPISIKSLEMFILDVYFYATGRDLSSDVKIKNVSITKNEEINSHEVFVKYSSNRNEFCSYNTTIVKLFIDFNDLFISSLKLLTQTINEYRRNTKSI